MAYRCFEVEVASKVAHVRLSRPDDLNVMVREFWTELPAIMRELDARGDTRALVISSTGRHFSAGMDLGVFTAGLGTTDDDVEVGRARAHVREVVVLLQRALTTFEQARMPVLVAVQGGCIGGAVDLVCAADMRYASADAYFVIQETNIGMTADAGTLQRLPKLIPDGIARELAYTGRRLTAARAAELGLVNEVFATHEALVSGVLEIAAEIAAKSPLATWGNKTMLLHARDHTVADGLDHIATWQSGMFQSADLMEGIAARAEGRDPDFPDLLPTPDSL